MVVFAEKPFAGVGKDGILTFRTFALQP